MMSLLVLLCCGSSPSLAGESPPNIVLIIGDDVGWTDYGFMGSGTVKTPNLDRLAAEGTVFTHAFSTDSLCQPALRTLLTGRTPQAVNAAIRRKQPQNAPPVPIREVLDTLPGKLGESGYASFQGGKFWEGVFEDGGFSDGMTLKVVPEGETVLERKPSMLSVSGAEGLELGRTTMQPLWDFLDAHRDDPFFVWYAPMLPHMPFDASDEFTRIYARDSAPPDRRAYWANMTRFDATVGALVARLAKLGLREKTLIVYVADNGWDSQGEQTVVGGPKGKGSQFELGVRTPMIAAWPGRIAAGARDDRLVSFLDIYPTLLDFAGVASARPNGRSLYPLLTGTGDFHREFVVGGAGPRGVKGRYLRTATWRYTVSTEGEEGLYLIGRDPREQNNLAAAQPELARALRRELVRRSTGRVESASSD
jgi:arylsulfatase A